MKSMDFLIIGAQKCATTTLFEHLRAHSGIQMPLEKEVPFFTEASCMEEGAWEAFAEQHFAKQRHRLWGKVTPQYMCDPNVPDRLYAHSRTLKLVAILRDPTQRTWSHYQMGRRRGTENRDFRQAMDELMTPDAQAAARAGSAPTHQAGYESEGDYYLAWSEYGRILQRYAALFGRDQLLVLYTEELESDPEGTLDRLLDFIGLEPGFRPETLGEVIHKGGGSNRIPHGVRAWLRNQRLVSALWGLVPPERQGRIRFLYEQWNVRKRRRPETMCESSRQMLADYFAADSSLIADITGQAPPWASAIQEV